MTQPPPGADIAKLEAALAAARAELEKNPNDPARIVWVGRRLGYLWRMAEAIDVCTRGIADHPDFAPLYRHRGHRYISLRRFNEAIDDLEKAAALTADRPDEIEQDGQPNAANVPLTTLKFNIWYHLGLARYLIGDFEGALAAYRENMKYLGGHDDNLAAVTDWMYMTLRRMGRDAEAAAVLAPISTDMKILENHAYHRRLLMYKGLLKPNELLNPESASDLDFATYGYGLGNWYYYNGDKTKAGEIFHRVVEGANWPAFGFVAAEVGLTRISRQ